MYAPPAVLGGGLSERGGDERPGEAVDLRTVVVEVVLAGDLAALGGEDAAERVADRGPAGATEVDRAGGVGGDELEVDPRVREVVAVAVGGALGEHLRHDRSLGVGGEPDVEEAGSRDLGGVDAVGGGQGLGEPGGEFAGIDADLLRDLHRDVGRVVAVLRIARALDGEGLGKNGRVETTVGEDTGGGSAEQLSKVGGSHRCPSYWLVDRGADAPPTGSSRHRARARP